MKCVNCGASMSKETDDLGMNITFNWFARLFDSIDSLSLDTKRKIIKGCSEAHYNTINMDNILNKYVGDIHSFIKFLETEWNWVVKLNVEEKIIYADENKPNCICPIVNLNEIKNTLMCNCSEGFAERMFSRILQQDATARVIKSVLRGDKSCVYEIRWE